MPIGLTIAVVAVATILAFLAFVAAQADSFRISRQRQLSAPPDKVFGLISDFHNWPLWSPWEKVDPDLKRSYSGAASGVGAVYDWSGNSKAGEGRMTILETTPAQQVKIKLEFIKPFTATNQITFQLTPAAGGTQVAWIMEGHKNFLAKAMHLLMDMDKMIGKDFEQGLTNLNEASKQ